MFAFKCPETGEFVSVYFDLKKYYFDYAEIKRLLPHNRLKSSRHRRLLDKLKEEKFLSINKTLKLLKLHHDTHKMQRFIIKQVLPVLLDYKKSLK
ncbi:ORF-133 [Agrotis segetum nucleopolyhedrovirus A]|uniref:ORF-133 n=1 Tax=Agrotis segetum nuclear polyhedrosis virus TaxID=1962501 RepID=Q287D9_NPVAS|nr:ORF-133 [Agrotis segetum nucleopolyhedrovirus A]AAZ38299.1 ORF-133 [Agrotis segetum nucleopolyhedrovirus A]